MAHEFPDPALAGPYGLVCLDRHMDTEKLVAAYRRGIFPWPDGSGEIPWVCPARRGVLDFADLHVPRTLQQARKKSSLTFTLDRDFSGVIANCREALRPGQRGTWITPVIVEAYIKLHRLGHAHSVEAWEDNQLVGGLYGVDAGGVFAGESMFHLVPNASKLCLLFLIDYLRTRGATWIDIQMVTPHMAALGAKEISRQKFLARLAATQAQKLSLFSSSSN